MGAASKGPEEGRGNSSELRRPYNSSEFLSDAVSIEVRADPMQRSDVYVSYMMYACVQYVGACVCTYSTTSKIIGALHVLSNAEAETQQCMEIAGTSYKSLSTSRA